MLSYQPVCRVGAWDSLFRYAPFRMTGAWGGAEKRRAQTPFGVSFFQKSAKKFVEISFWDRQFFADVL